MKLITDKKQNGMTNSDFTKYLKTPVPKSELNQLEVDILRDTLFAALKGMGGVGLSANQIGVNKRACVIKFNDVELFLLNPVITERSNEGFIFYEGCLSMPDTIKKPVRTLRSTYVVVQTDNLGELRFEITPEEDRKLEGQVSEGTMKTVVVQHEIDHLDGITIKDRVYSTTITKKQSYGRNDKIIMKAPNGDFVEVKYKKANNYFLKGYEVV
jgi:peptide deformylase